MWFFEGSIFVDWMSTGSLLWVHGKRTFLFSFATQLLTVSNLLSGLGEEHSLVRHFPTIVTECENSY